jgi:hypothetical protein
LDKIISAVGYNKLADDINEAKMKKNVKRVLIIAGLLFLLCWPFWGRAILYCLFDRICIWEEISRHQSPDGKVDAVFTRSYCGPPGSSFWRIYVVPAGTKITKIDERKERYPVAFGGWHIKGVEISWVRSGILEIRYKEGEVVSFCNSISPFGRRVEYDVEIRETPLDPCSSLFKWER